jgi:hypothetical protein
MEKILSQSALELGMIITALTNFDSIGNLRVVDPVPHCCDLSPEDIRLGTFTETRKLQSRGDLEVHEFFL